MKTFLSIHPGMRFSCTRCGHCCRGWSIQLTEAEVGELGKTDWGGVFPDLRGRTLWEETRASGGGRAWRFRLREDGACPFLGPAEECRLHARGGPDAKPLTCRLFPYTLIDTPAGPTVGLRFNCPGVVGAQGEKLSEQARDLERLWRDLGRAGAAPAVPDSVPLDRRAKVDARDRAGLQAAVMRILGEKGMSFPRRLLVLLRLIELLEGAKVATLSGERLEQLLALVAPEFLAEAAAAPAPVRAELGGGERVQFQQCLGIFYAREYAAIAHRPFRERWRLRWRAYGDALRFLFQRGSVTPAGGAGPVPLARVWAQPGPAEDAAWTAAWERYFQWKVFSQSTYGALLFDFPYLPGLCLLAVAFGAITWYARAFSIARGAAAATLEDVQRGMEYVEGTLSGARRIGGYQRLVLRSLARAPVAARIVRAFLAEGEKAG